MGAAGPMPNELVMSLGMCRGVFGCHTALVLRRLRRVCQLEHNSSPMFVVASATIANPRDHVMSLLGKSIFLLVHAQP